MKTLITMNIPDELLKEIDSEAKRLYISRTAYIITTISQRIQSERLAIAMPKIAQIIQQAAKDPLLLEHMANVSEKGFKEIEDAHENFVEKRKNRRKRKGE